MSTSPRRSPSPAAAATTPPVKLPAFPYPEIASGSNPCPGENLADAGLWSADPNAGTQSMAAREARARELGLQEGQAEARKIFEEQLARERAALTVALAGFTRDRGTYYQKIEGEVVQLALAIARKILHREAQVDSLLLAGVVRVALEQIEGATGVVLSVHPQHSADWRNYLARHMEPGDLPEIVEDPALELDRCVLRTSMGTAELGVQVQLKEIEQGLMDLLAARPRETP